MNKTVSWAIIFALILGLIYLVANTLVPFFIAFVIAYLLQPIIDNNARRLKMPRNAIANLTFLSFLGLFIIIMVILVPIIYKQFAAFVEKAPEYRHNFEQTISNLQNKLHIFDSELAEKIEDGLRHFIDNIFQLFGSFANHIWEYTLATINIFTIICLVPILLYYFLRDWPHMVQSIENLLPIRGKSKFHQFFHEINELLSAYIRGQLNICLMLACYYVAGLTLIGIDLALLLGILSGFLIIIPFIGAMISFGLVLISCYFNYGAGSELLYTILLFTIGHTIEGYILAPKIIGERIGLHPIWIIFAVFAAGSLFGIIGILFAIPLAGIVKVSLSYMIDYYKTSDMYKN